MRKNEGKHDRQAIALDVEVNWQPTTDLAAWNEDPIQSISLTSEEIRKRQHWAHVDNVRDIISFWREGIEAAERGEVLSMQDFLETVGHSSWANASNEWQYAYSENGWGSQRPESRDSWRIGSDSPWGKVEVAALGHARTASDSHLEFADWEGRTVEKKEKKRKTNNDDTYALVETIARDQAVNPERKRRMQEFIEVCHSPDFVCN